jgi:DNA-binding beta-propeller fold protein YncE
MRRNLRIGATLLSILVALGLGCVGLENRAALQAAGLQGAAGAQAPMFEVDPMWPKPLPNNWVMGWTVGVGVDAQDHIWVVHRPDSLEPPELYGKSGASECCFPAPPILEFDQAGNLIGHFGGPGQGYDWPVSVHGVSVDHKGNVWVGSSGKGDNHILKFTQDGRFLLQIGRPNSSRGSNDVDNLNQPAEVFVDRVANEAYVADGYGNKRVIVFDADTGRYKRHWGAYGRKPDDTNLGPYNPDAPPPPQFRSPVHGVEISNDGLVYVADRLNDRIQVFRKDGTFVKEGFVARRTLGDGAVFDVGISRDPQQQYLYVPDGSNHKVHILLRDTLEVLTTFGAGGRQPGQFYAVHNLITDSRGNIFTVETRRGQRVQRFVYKGIGKITKKDQGVLWPETAKRPM